MTTKRIIYAAAIGLAVAAPAAHAGTVAFTAQPGMSYKAVVVKFTQPDGPHSPRDTILNTIGSHILRSEGSELEIRPLLEMNADAQGRSLSSPADSDPQGLGRYYRISIPADRQHVTAFVDSLLTDLASRPDVETVYPDLEPVSLLALGAGLPSIRAGGSEIGSGRSVSLAAVGATPDLTHGQLYLQPPGRTANGYRLGGIDTDYAWRFAGGRGEGVTIVSKEPGAWNPEHVDLPTPAMKFGKYEVDDHDTMSVGIMAAVDNGFGMTGIANLATLSYAGSDFSNFAALRHYLKQGDVLQIGIQVVAGPVAGCKGDCLLPMELAPAWFDAIKDLTDKGVIVVEAAGNGNINLDHPDFKGKFDRSRNDSGAILVGAVCAKDARRAGFSNYGSRIDSSSWGCWDVATTTGSSSSADLWSGQNNWYTASFSGTSSANPIVAGAAASISGYAKRNGVLLTPAGVRALLTRTGTTFDGGDSTVVGTQPDLKRAFLGIDKCVGSMSSEKVAR